ncbi:MAG: hypothetical protein QM742_19655 [Aquabacterium sp.]
MKSASLAMNLVRLALMAALSAGAVMAEAAQVTLQYTGAVAITTDGGPALGSTVTGRVSYDTAPEVADYFGSKFFTWTTPTSFTMDVGDAHYSAMMVAGFLGGGGGDETLQLQGLNYNPDDGMSLSPRLMLAFTGPEGSFGGGVPTAINVGAMSVHAGGLFMVDEFEPRFMFEVSSVSSVPEPSAVLTALAGLMVVGARARRRMA